MLDDLTCADEATRMRARDEAEDLLRTQWSSSVIGFHSCRQALLEKALRDYLHAGADGALDKGVSAALQTDILARVYHDRFPIRSAGSAPKRARTSD